MKYSLILCVKNGGEQLRTCLDHMAVVASDDDLDVVLVDNGSTDGKTLDALKDFAAMAPCPCSVVQCTKAGNSAGRNAALPVARGDVLLFIDADCYVAPDFVKAWKDVFATHSLGYATGRILRYSLDSSPLGCNESGDQIPLAPGSFVSRGFVQGSNMAFLRTCLERAGAFDDRFGAGTPFAGEGWDLALRISFAGFAGGYYPGPTVSHDHQRKEDVADARQLFYDYGAGAVYAKHLFTPHWAGVLRKLAGETWRLLTSPARLGMLGAGFVAYFFPKTGRSG